MKLSIIITAWNLENFIEQALESCLQDGLGDHEIIVVDNASSDRTADLVRRFSVGSGKNLNIIIIQHDSNLGPGQARNSGLAAATGDYVLFLDGDDWFFEHSLAAVRESLTSRKPEVLLFSYRRVQINGSVGLDRQSKMLTVRDEYTIEDRQELLRTFSVAWNKAYNRAFLEKNKFRFKDGLYEDVSWSFHVLLLATHVATLPVSVIAYRQRLRSITHSTGPEHFSVFGEYRRVFDVLKAEANLSKSYGQIIYGYARSQMITISKLKRIPRDLESAYVEKLISELELYRSILAQNGVAIIEKDRSLQFYKIGGATFFRIASKLAGNGKKKLARIKKKSVSAARRAKEIMFKIYGRMLCVKPVKKNKVFFESYWGAKADCNPLAIAKALDDTGGYDIVWSFTKRAEIPDDFPWRHVRRGSFSMMREAADAGYFVSNANLYDHIIKRPDAIHLQTWHGTPLKLMGIDIRKTKPSEMNWDNFVKRSVRWDYMLSSNPHSSAAWRRGCPFNYTMIESGYPRNDIFFTATADDISNIRSRIGIPEGKKVALYAPTVRDHLKGKALSLRPDVFDVENVASALGPEWVLLVRAHYFLKPVTGTLHHNCSIIDVSAYQKSNEIALISDLLITDYSSLMFDYSCTQRPIILYQYDYDDYSTKRGMYFDISKTPPGPIVFSQDELIKVLESKSFYNQEHLENAKKFSDIFSPWDDGHAAQRVLESVFLS